MSPSNGRLQRRRILHLAVSIPMTGCASVPDIVHLPPRLLGLHADGPRPEGHAPEQLVSLAWVRALAGDREFRITANGEDVLHAPAAKS